MKFPRVPRRSGASEPSAVTAPTERPDPSDPSGRAPGPAREDGQPMGVAQRATRARGSLIRQLPAAVDLRRAIDAPTMRDTLLPAMPGPEVAGDAEVLRVLDLALRVGEVQLATGAGAAVAHDTMLAIATAYGLPVCDVDIAFSTITMCCHRGNEAGPVTTMRNVRYRTQDYTRLAEIDDLIRAIVDRDVPLDLDTAFERLAAAADAGHPYPRFVAGLSRSAFAAAVALLIGGGGTVALATFLLTGVVWGTARFLGRRYVPMFFQQVVGAAMVTVTATVLASSGFLDDSPAYVVAAGLVVLLSGMSLVGLVQDAITGFPLTAAGRLVEVSLASAGLLVGVVMSIRVASAIGGDSVLSYASTIPTPGVELGPMQFGAAAAAGLFFALSAYAPLRSLPWAALSGAISWAVYAASAQAGAGTVVAAAFAAAVLGLTAMLIPRRAGLPPLVLVVAGITPLLPGLTLYRGFTELANDAVGNGSVTILLALTFSLALAAGVSLGEQVGWPVVRRARRVTRRRPASAEIGTGAGGGSDERTARQRRAERRPRVF